MSVLIVVAHPDDEVLGCGGTVSQITAKGVVARACVVCGDAEAREMRPELSELHDDLRAAGQVLGLSEPILGQFPNIRLNAVPHLEVVQFIEQAIVENKVDTILTHHPSDLNDDHLHVSRACLAAARLFQRKAGIPMLREVLFMEVLSSTDWSFSYGQPVFQANTFSELSEKALGAKIEALGKYRKVMRTFPHPRSEQAIRALASFRGSQCGAQRAEAFQSVHRLLGW